MTPSNHSLRREYNICMYFNRQNIRETVFSLNAGPWNVLTCSAGGAPLSHESSALRCSVLCALCDSVLSGSTAAGVSSSAAVHSAPDVKL